MDFVKEHAAADGGDLRMSILTLEWKKTESDLDNRTGRLQRMLHSPCSDRRQSAPRNFRFSEHFSLCL